MCFVTDITSVKIETTNKHTMKDQNKIKTDIATALNIAAASISCELSHTKPNVRRSFLLYDIFGKRYARPLMYSPRTITLQRKGRPSKPYYPYRKGKTIRLQWFLNKL